MVEPRPASHYIFCVSKGEQKKVPADYKQRNQYPQLASVVAVVVVTT